MGLMRCFAKHHSIGPAALPAPPTTNPTASPSRPPPPSSPRRDKTKVVRAPDRTEPVAVSFSGPAPGFVPRTVAEIHPEYAHSEPYHFTANTDSCRMVVSSAQVAARRAGDLRMRAQVLPSPPKPKPIIVRGPQFSARIPAKSPSKSTIDDIDEKENSHASPMQPDSRKSQVALVVERPRTYLADKNDQPVDEDVASRSLSRKLKSPLRRAWSKKNISKKATPPASPSKSPAIKSAVINARKHREDAEKNLRDFDEADEAERSAQLELFDSTPVKTSSDSAVYKPVPVYPNASVTNSDLPDDGEVGDPDDSVFDENEFADAPNSFDDQEGEVRCTKGCCDPVPAEHGEYEEDAYNEDNYRESERNESEDESEDRFSELKQTYPHDREMDSNVSESESDNESEPEVSADGFLAEDPGASARSSVRSSIRSDFRSSIDFRSSVRSSVRSSMRSCIDRYSMDSQYQQSMDGDRVASTFDFMRGGDNEATDDESDYLTTLDSRGYSMENPQAEILAPLRVPQSPAGSFKSKSDSEEGSMRAITVHKTSGPHPGNQVRRMDSTLSSPRHKAPPSALSPAPRRLADKSEVVYGHVEEGGSGRVKIQRQAAPMRASPQKRKTVSFRPDRPVVIEPNLRDRSPAQVAAPIATGKKRLVSALRSTPKPPTRAELAAKRVEEAERRQRDRSDVIHSPGSSFGSLQRIGVASPNSSFNSLPRNVGNPSGSAPNLFSSLPRNIGKQQPTASPNSSFASLPDASAQRRSKRESTRGVAPEELSRRRSAAVANALSQQIRGVPKSAMLAYDEHDEDEETESDIEDEENINVNQLGGQLYNGRGVRGSLRHRARSVSTREMRFPPDVIPGQVPEPPPPPPFAPQDTRVRSVRRAPPPPSPRSSLRGE